MKKQWSDFVTAEQMNDDLQKFIATHHMDDEDSLNVLGDKPAATSTNNPFAMLQHTNTHQQPSSSFDAMIDDDDDPELARALQASLEQQQQPIVNNTVEQPMEAVTTTPQPVKFEDADVDPQKYIVDTPSDSTRIQLKFPDGKREAVRVSLKAPLAALYALYRRGLGEEFKPKKFVIVFVNSELENTKEKTLADANITNASLSIRFDE